MHPLTLRRNAVEAVRRDFFGQKLDFKAYDCARLCCRLLRELGHDRDPMKGAKFQTYKGAVRWMRQRDHKSILPLVDAHLERIPPARAVVGDILALPTPAKDPFGAALCVVMDNRCAIGWGEGENLAGILEPNLSLSLAAWRTI